ncbi:hypothetical protein [Nocardia sp. NPDC059239]|uniref:hypothetical protein n=1 Tax=Nocardia sp. NPDC059239 TaxID=3346785 RepID=UPI003697A942
MDVMSRQTDDGKHEGFVTAWFPDGMLGTGFTGNTVFARMPCTDGRKLHDYDRGEEVERPDSEVAGWQPVCECGWRGSLWRRVATEAEQDLTVYRAYSRDSLSDDFDEMLMVEWEQHIAPATAVHEVALITAEIRDAEQRRVEAVTRARAAGASWEAIAQAANITRQSAHERWSKITR